METIITIPPIFVLVFLLWADVSWYLYIKYKLPFNARALLLTLITETVLYLLFTVYDVDIQLRAVLVRVTIIMISLSMAFPLTMHYFIWRIKNATNAANIN